MCLFVFYTGLAFPILTVPYAVNTISGCNFRYPEFYLLLVYYFNFQVFYRIYNMFVHDSKPRSINYFKITAF